MRPRHNTHNTQHTTHNTQHITHTHTTRHTNTQHVNSNTSHVACTDAHTLSAHHIALIPCTTSVAQGQPDCVAKTCRFISSLSRDVSCCAQNTQHFILHFFLCSRSVKVDHPEFPALIDENKRVTDVLIQSLPQVMSLTGSSTTRSLLNRRILLALKTIRSPKLRVMSKLCPQPVIVVFYS